MSPLGGGNWDFSTLYAFPALQGGNGPVGKLLMDAAGNLYGTSMRGGAYYQGLVFRLTPTNGGWELTSLHEFQFPQEGMYPNGDLYLDGNGNLFGTAFLGGISDHGTVWEITP